MAGKASNRVLVLLGILVTAVLLAGVSYFALQSPSGTTVLPNGTRITALGVSRGGEFFTTEKRWQQAARKLLPARWQSWIPAPFCGLSIGKSNSLTVWLKAENAKGTPIPQRSEPWGHCFCAGEDGSKLPMLSHPCYFRTNGLPGGTYPTMLPAGLYNFECDTLARRQTALKLDFYDAKEVLLGSLKVRIPFARTPD